MDAKKVVMAAALLALVAGMSILAMPAAADGKDKGWRDGKWDNDRDRDKWDRDWYYRGGGYPVVNPGYTYPVAYPVAYPVYVPANFGGDQGACYQACVNAGQYSPAQCGQWCYYA